MHRARTFFLVCAGIFLLALAYTLGAMTATPAWWLRMFRKNERDVNVRVYPGEPIVVAVAGNNSISRAAENLVYSGRDFMAWTYDFSHSFWRLPTYAHTELITGVLNHPNPNSNVDCIWGFGLGAFETAGADANNNYIGMRFNHTLKPPAWEPIGGGRPATGPSSGPRPMAPPAARWSPPETS